MKTILLLVEDDDHKARAVQRWIAREGIEVIRATTMVAAVRAIREGAQFAGEVHKVGAVLTDWVFPFRDGEHIRDHAGQRVHDEAVKAGLPVAVFSGREEPVTGIANWIASTDYTALTRWLQRVNPGKLRGLRAPRPQSFAHIELAAQAVRPTRTPASTTPTTTPNAKVSNQGCSRA